MESFMSDAVADALYTGKFGKFHMMAKREPFRPVEELPDEIKDWVSKEQPGTTHIRIGPVFGDESRNEMIWWVGGWKDPKDLNDEMEKPTWESKIVTQWRKT